jgi:hypothetical protein
VIRRALRSRRDAPAGPGPAALVAAAILGWAALADAGVVLLPPEIAAKLTAVNERPMDLAADGEARRFLSGAESWQEALPPSLVDADRDGARDYIITLLVDEKYGRRALIARQWGADATAFGPTVFYVILEESDEVVEWAGTPELAVPTRPSP